MYSSGDIIDEIFSNPKFDAMKNQILRAFVYSYAYSNAYKQRINAQIRNPPPDYHPQTVLNRHLLPNKSTAVEIMEKIIDYDENHDHLIDLNSLSGDGKSVFTSIRYNNNETSQVTKLLLSNGANPNILDSEGQLPLEHAIKYSNMMNPLLNSNKIDFELRFTKIYSFGNEQLFVKTTYFHSAALLRHSDFLNLLLEKYPEGINLVDEFGETFLMIACRASIIQNIDLLFEKDNLDFLHRNNLGKDALDILKEEDNDDVENARKNKNNYHLKILEILNRIY